MREIKRTIVSAVIISSDGKILMGRKDPARGGVYPDCWHIPGGGVDQGESLEQALIREVREEVGINLLEEHLSPLPEIGEGVAEKTMPNGETVLCHMEFHRFEARIPKPNNEINLTLGDDLVETRWFGPTELANVQQIPGGKEFFQRMGYL
jgi:nucleoside triphosphatase